MSTTQNGYDAETFPPGTHDLWNPPREHHGDTSPPSLFPHVEDYLAGTANDGNAVPVTVSLEQEPHAEYIRAKHGADTDAHRYHHTVQYNHTVQDPSPDHGSRAAPPPDTSSTSDAIIAHVVLPIAVGLLALFALRQGHVIYRREEAFVRTREAQWAAARERRRARAKERRARREEIERALVCQTASECTCDMTSSSPKEPVSVTSGLATTVNATDDMSTSSPRQDMDDPSSENETQSSQMCAICLEPYTPAEDQVAWSKFQTCRHAFHHGCITEWLAEAEHPDGRCPCCRGPYLRKDATQENAEAAGRAVAAHEDRGRVDEDGPEDAAAAGAPDEESQNHRTEAHAAKEEGEAGRRERSGEGNAPTPEQGGRVVDDDGAMTCQLEGTTATVILGSAFTSFCIVHGLSRDENKQCNGNLLLRGKFTGDPQAGLENV